MKAFIRPQAVAILVLSIALAGCSSNPTNEPTQSEIDKANEARFKAIDDNPNYTPEQKEAMKSRFGGYKKPEQSGGR